MPNPTQNRNVLKSYFETNNVPSEQDYADLIDAALIQTDDGLYKFPGDPLIIDAGVNPSPRQPVLQLNRHYGQNPAPDWLIELDPNAGNGPVGLNIQDVNQNSALFLTSAPDARVGIGTLQPGARLHIHNDSPAAWDYSALQQNISLELGHAGAGGVGSVKLNGPAAQDFLFLRAGGDAARMDYSSGEYLLNGDPSVTGGHPGVLQIADGNGNPRVKLHSDGSSFFTSGNLGIGTENPQARLQVTGGAIMPQPGNNDQSGIMFPRDPFGGGGDAAWIRYYNRVGESTTFEIGTSNDGDDNIALYAPGGVGINTNDASAALDIFSLNPHAISLHSNQWNTASRFRINTVGTLADGRVEMTWDGLGFAPLAIHNDGSIFVKGPERQDGLGLRLGAVSGEYGIFAEAGAGAIGGAEGVSMQNGQVRLLPSGNLGIGTAAPGAKLTVANDSPAAYLYSDVANHVSLELGKDGPGALGAIKLHAYDPGHFNFIRPSNGNLHMDSSRGYYYLNWDPSVHGGEPGRFILGGRSGDNLVFLNTEGDSHLVGGKLGIGTTTPGAMLTVANDSPSHWHHAVMQDHISLELGKNGDGNGVGSIKMHSSSQDHFAFIRPSNGNLHLDSTRGAYFFNWDPSSNGGQSAQILVGDGQGQEKITLRADGHSYFLGGNLGIGTNNPQAKLQVTGGAIMPMPGNGDQAGIMFPRDPFGGGGDAAWIRYYNRVGESTTFEIGTTNDWDDNIALMSTGGVGINTNAPTAALEINSPTDNALALRNNAWAPGKRFRLNTAGNGTAGFRWDGHNYPMIQFHDIGRIYIKDMERQDGNGLRLGTAWGMYGIYAEAGPAVVGGAEGVHLQHNLVTISSSGYMAIGPNKTPGTGKLLVEGRVDIQQGATPLFGGVHQPVTNNRAQLVLQSEYSDLVVASSQVNNQHGSTLSFATYNPGNAADYRKFVFNQGNWGARKHMMEIGYVDQPELNPHAVVSTSNVMTLNGLQNRVGIANRDPQHALDVNGEVRTSKPYMITSAASFTVDGDFNKWYPVLFNDDGWLEGVLELEIFRPNTHTDSSWRGTIMARIKNHNSNWGHGSEFWELDVTQTGRFVAGVAQVRRSAGLVIWLRGGGTTYFWRSNHKVRLLNYAAVDTKIVFPSNGGPEEETVNSITALPPSYNRDVYHKESRNNGESFQPGMIMMWSGTAAPWGWAICDGTNGTPDLRGRFVLGAGQGNGLSNRPVGQVGGAESVALSVSQLPPHSHGVNDPGHFHTWSGSRQQAGTDDRNNTQEFSRGDAGAADTVIKNTDAKATGISLQNTGSGAAHENMPPFYVLAFIMKLAL